jgi:REP element-mobilizing transposase RayT
VWQRNYWEHIIRNETELQQIREYIRNNPVRWELDKLNPVGAKNFSPLP